MKLNKEKYTEDLEKLNIKASRLKELNTEMVVYNSIYSDKELQEILKSEIDYLKENNKEIEKFHLDENEILCDFMVDEIIGKKHFGEVVITTKIECDKDENASMTTVEYIEMYDFNVFYDYFYLQNKKLEISYKGCCHIELSKDNFQFEPKEEVTMIEKNSGVAFWAIDDIYILKTRESV